jgi:hypothetical protein
VESPAAASGCKQKTAATRVTRTFSPTKNIEATRIFFLISCCQKKTFFSYFLLSEKDLLGRNALCLGMKTELKVEALCEVVGRRRHCAVVEVEQRAHNNVGDAVLARLVAMVRDGPAQRQIQHLPVHTSKMRWKHNAARKVELEWARLRARRWRW